jgi:hypothetical protein
VPSTIKKDVDKLQASIKSEGKKEKRISGSVKDKRTLIKETGMRKMEY